MHPEILEGPQKSLLALLERAAIPPALYLAGGTALALHLGHRKSVDLDFFYSEVFETADLLTLLQRAGEFQVRRNDPGALTARVEGVEVSFLDAEEERMPVMLWPCRWDEVKAFFVHESQRVFST